MASRRHEIRGEMKRILTNLDPRWLKAASQELCEQLSALLDTRVERKVEHLLAWVNFFPGEVDLSCLIGEQLGVRKVYLPRVFKDGTMKFLSVGSDWIESMGAGEYGIPEPSDAGEAFDKSKVSESAVFVPGLAFDKLGSRLGRGKGYYDRFLGTPEMSSILKIGVCWSLQIVDEIPAESHDVPVDWICHERGAIRTGAQLEDDE